MRLIIVTMLAAASTAAADPGPTDAGWPATTVAAKVRYGIAVLDGIHGKRIGTIAAGTRVTWQRIVPAKDGCRAWLELAPRGWACARDLAPTGDAAGPDPEPPEERWADIVTDGADAYDDRDAIVAGAPSRHVGDKTYVAMSTKSRSLVVDRMRYYHTDQGWIRAADLVWYDPSPFAGVELAPAVALDFGWSVARKPGAKIAVRDGTGAVVRQLSPRDRVTIVAVEGDRARIGADELVDLVELRRPAVHARPEGVAADERWIDVDLDQQWLILYEGDAPVFTTLVSTGRVDWQTPTGIYRIRGKEARARMQDPGGMADEWNVADVPWSMRFRRNFALHGTYWHDGFGRARSHGCVNLSTSDARRIYDWVTPVAPGGWTEVESDGQGTPVRIHSLKDPEPTWRDFDGKPTR